MSASVGISAGDAAKRLGIVGLGQCGGNIAARFAARDYPVLCANTSASELRSHGLPDAQLVQLGSGTETWGASIAAALDALGAVELVLAIGGLGGGAGGSLATVVHVLDAVDLDVVAVGVLPARTDSFAVKKNALAAINALVEAPFESLVLVDNQKLHGSHSDRSIDRYLAACNESVVEAFDRIHRASEQPGLTPVRSFELRAFKSALSGGGVAVFGEREIDGPLSHEALLQACVDVINHNPLLATDYELEDVVTLGSVVVASHDLLRDTPVAVFDTYYDEIQLLTGGVTHDVGIYRGEVEKPRLSVIASGLRLPSMVQRMLADLTAEAGRVRQKRAGVRQKLSRLDLGSLPAALEAPPPRRKPSSSVTADGEVVFDIGDADEIAMIGDPSESV